MSKLRIPSATYRLQFSGQFRFEPARALAVYLDQLGVTELHGRQMGLLLDIVPNHMVAGSENPWWMHVLEDGPGSAYASFFDSELGRSLPCPDWSPGWFPQAGFPPARTFGRTVRFCSSRMRLQNGSTF